MNNKNVLISLLVLAGVVVFSFALLLMNSHQKINVSGKVLFYYKEDAPIVLTLEIYNAKEGSFISKKIATLQKNSEFFFEVPAYSKLILTADCNGAGDKLYRSIKKLEISKKSVSNILLVLEAITSDYIGPTITTSGKVFYKEGYNGVFDIYIIAGEDLKKVLEPGDWPPIAARKRITAVNGLGEFSIPIPEKIGSFRMCVYTRDPVAKPPVYCQDMDNADSPDVQKIYIRL
jgi:hypothetical protein